MNWQQIEVNWDEFKDKVKEQWGKLTDADLAAIRGNRDKLANKLRQLYGRARDVIEREIDDFCGCVDSDTDDDCSTSTPQ